MNNSSSHGNYVTGMIAGTLQEDSNGFMVRGVNPDEDYEVVSRPYNFNAEQEALAITYATNNGAKVINLSHRMVDNFDMDVKVILIMQYLPVYLLFWAVQMRAVQPLQILTSTIIFTP